MTSKRLLLVGLCAALAGIGCGDITPLGDDGGGRGGSSSGAGGKGGTTGAGGSTGAGGARDAGADGRVVCDGLDEAQCRAQPTCVPGGCPTCNGGINFSRCYDASSPPPPTPCPNLCPVAPCSSITTRAACEARAECRVAGCPDCNGGTSFLACYDVNGLPPSISCPRIACPIPCSSLRTKAECEARATCRVAGCPDCNGGVNFSACYDVESPPPPIACPAIACPAPCSLETTQANCDARPDCHSVFKDPHNCACAALGCCARFSFCAQGATANCKSGAALCDAVQPYCEGPYVVSYTPGCYEGCVNVRDCANN